MSKRIFWLFSLLGILAVVGVAVFFVAAQGDGEPAPLEGDNVTTYDYTDDPAFLNSTRTLRQAEKAEDGSCIFTGYMEGGPDGPPLASRVLQVNWDTCEYIEEEGELNPAQLQDDPGPDDPDHGYEEIEPELPNPESDPAGMQGSKQWDFSFSRLQGKILGSRAWSGATTCRQRL